MADFGSTQGIFEAMQGFVNATQGFAVAKNITQANQRAQDIKSQLIPEAEKRKALTNVADSVFANLLAQGADPNVAAGLRSSILPVTPNTAEQAVWQGTLSGDSAMVQAGQQVLQQQENAALRRIQAQAVIGEQSQLRLFEQQDKIQDKRFQQQQQAEAIKAAAAPGTSDQNKAASYAARMVQAENIFGSLAAQKYTGTDFWDRAPGYLPQGVRSDNYQKNEQAQRNYINAVLRRESGAAISDSEFASARQQYFPQPGDSPAVVQQKKENRRLATQGIASEAGPAWTRLQERLPGAANLFDDKVSDVGQVKKGKLTLKNSAKSYLEE